MIATSDGKHTMLFDGLQYVETWSNGLNRLKYDVFDTGNPRRVEDPILSVLTPGS